MFILNVTCRSSSSKALSSIKLLEPNSSTALTQVIQNHSIMSSKTQCVNKRLKPFKMMTIIKTIDTTLYKEQNEVRELSLEFKA